MPLHQHPLSMLALLSSAQVPSLAKRKGYAFPADPEASGLRREARAKEEVELVKERVRHQIAVAFDEIFAVHKAAPDVLSHSAAFLHCADLILDEVVGAGVRAKHPEVADLHEEMRETVSDDAIAARLEQLPDESKQRYRRARMAHAVARFGFELIDTVAFPVEGEPVDDHETEMLARLERMHEIADAAVLHRADNRIVALRDLEAAAPFADLLSRMSSTGDFAKPERERLLSNLANLTAMHMARFALEERNDPHATRGVPVTLRVWARQKRSALYDRALASTAAAATP